MPGQNRQNKTFYNREAQTMQILATNFENLKDSKKLLYKMTVSAGKNVQKMTEEERSKSYPVDVYVLYDDVNEKGEEHQILAILSGKDKLSTISQTFIKSFMRIVDLMDGDPFSILVTGGESKNGRKYVDCELDCDV